MPETRQRHRQIRRGDPRSVVRRERHWISLALFLAFPWILLMGCDLRDSTDVTMLEDHHWMALQAIENADGSEATHHIEHIIELVDGEHRLRMQEAASLLAGGELHEAQHLIEEMLVGVAAPELSGRQIHLHMALQATQREDFEQAGHHTEHFASEAPEFRDMTDLVAEALMRADGGAAEEELREILAAIIDTDSADPSCDNGAPLRADPSTIRTAVLWDDDWSRHHGGVPVDASSPIFEDARIALTPLGVTLDIVAFARWEAPPATSVRDLADAARQRNERATPLHDLLIVLTGRDFPGSVSGTYSESGSVVVVKYSHGSPKVVAATLVHEIGHFLGMEHRWGTYMQRTGFPLGIVWSDCQRDLTREQDGDS